MQNAPNLMNNRHRKHLPLTDPSKSPPNSPTKISLNYIRHRDLKYLTAPLKGPKFSRKTMVEWQGLRHNRDHHKIWPPSDQLRTTFRSTPWITFRSPLDRLRLPEWVRKTGLMRLTHRGRGPSQKRGNLSSVVAEWSRGDASRAIVLFLSIKLSIGVAHCYMSDARPQSNESASVFDSCAFAALAHRGPCAGSRV